MLHSVMGGAAVFFRSCQTFAVMKPTFEFAALKFLMLWERTEAPLHSALNADPQPGDVRRALRHFQVVRNFAGIKDDRKAVQVAKLLAKADQKSNYGPEQKVEYLADLFFRSFNTRNVSAASKLLWLLRRHPYVIYDSRAVDAIAALAEAASFEDYHRYCQAWREQYELRQTAIQSATERLLAIEAFTSVWQASSASLASLIAAPWFCERVFDIYLWEFGHELAANTSIERTATGKPVAAAHVER